MEFGWLWSGKAMEEKAGEAGRIVGFWKRLEDRRLTF